MRRLLRIVVRLAALLFAVTVIGVGVLFVVDWRARRANEVRIIEVPFTTPGRDALTIGRIIFIQSDKADKPDLLAHELVHVCQWEEQGLEFLWNYASEYGENLLEQRDPDIAYVELSFEEEARLGTVDCDLDHYVVP